MTHKQIEKYRATLVEILNQQKSQERTDALFKLAKEIGASTGRKRSGEDVDPVGLVDNIHQALQTATMIDMCRTASKNCWMALVSALVALISAVAAWTAVYMGILEKLAKSPF